MDERIAHILMVEDEAAHADFLRRVFKAHADRFRLTLARSLAEARARLAESQPDLVITDLLLPDGRGIELVRAQDGRPAFPMVVMTSHGTEQVAVEAMKAGALDYVVKSTATLSDMPHVAERALREWGHILQRARAEKALQESQAFLDGIYSGVELPIVVMDITADDDFRVAGLNPAYERLGGVRLEEVRGKRLAELLQRVGAPPEAAAAVRDNYNRCLKAGEPVQYEESVPLWGRRIWWLTSLTPLRSADGQFYRIVVTLLDITERKQAEEALRESETRFRTLAENVPGAIYVCRNDARWTMLYLNDGIETLTGYPKEDFLSDRLSFADLYHPDDAAMMMPDPEDERFTESRRTFHYEYRIKHRSGEWRWLEEWGAGVFNERREFLFLEGFMSNITARKQTEEERSRLLERMQRQHDTLIRLATHPALAEGRLDEALPVVAEAVTEALDVDRINVCRLADDHRELRCMEAFDRSTGQHARGLILLVERYPRFLTALEAGRVVDANDVRVDPRTTELTLDLWEPEGIGACLAAPIRLRGQVIGLVCHDHAGAQRAWTPDEITFAGQVADLVSQAFLNADLRRRADELAAITRVSREITSAPSLRPVLDSIARHAAELSGTDASGVFAFRSDGRLYVEAGYGVSDEFIDTLNARGVTSGKSAIGRAVAGRQSVQIPDVEAEPDYDYRQVAQTERIRSVLAVPMLRGDEVIGGIVLWHPQRRHFSAQEVAVIEALAQQCVNAVENARLFEEVRRQAEEMTALYHTSLDIGSAANLPDLLWTICDRAAQLIGVDKGGLYLYDEARQELELVVSYKLDRDFTGARLKLGEGIGGRVAQTGQPLIVSDYSQWEQRAQVYNGEAFTTVIGVPLKWQAKVIGAITLSRETGQSNITADDERLLSLFAHQAAIAIANARLFEAEARRRREAETLQAATQALSATLDLRQVLELILDQLQQVVPYDSTSVQQSKGDVMEIIAGRGFRNPDEVLGIRFDLTASDNPNREVVRTRAPVIVDDTLSINNAFNREPFIQSGIRSWLGVPLLFGDRLIGMITLDRREPGFYTPEHARLALAFAAQAAIAIENARAIESERAQLRLAQTLQAVGALLTTQMSLDEVFERLFDLLAQVIQYDSVSVQLIQSDGMVELTAGRGFPELETARQAVRAITGQVVKQRFGERHTVVIPDTHAAAGWIRGTGSDYIRSWIGAALVVKGTLVGVLNIDSRIVNAYNEAIGETAAAFANQAAIAIENARAIESERAQLRLAQTLQAVGALLTARMSLDDVFESLFNLLAQVVHYDSVSVQMLGEDGHMHLTAGRGFLDAELARQNVRLVSERRPADVWYQQNLIVITDTRTDERWIKGMGADYIRAWIGAALLVRGQLIGILTADSATPNAYSATDAETVRAFANQAAVAIVNARMFADLKQGEIERERLLTDLRYRNTQLLTAAEVAKSAITLLDPEALINQAVSLIHDRFGYHYAGLFLIDEANAPGWATLRAGSGEAGRHMLTAGHRLAIGDQSMVGWCIAHAAARVTGDVAVEAVHFHNPYLSDTRSEMALPLVVRGRPIGALTVQSTQVAAFSDEDVAILQAMADQLATAIENARLYEAAQREIARRAQAEAEVRQLNEELEQRVVERTQELVKANEELEAFSYSVSHDLRAPLRHMDGFVRLLLKRAEEQLDPTAARYVSIIAESANRMGQLIDALLALSRMSRTEMKTRPVDLNELVRSAQRELAPLLAQRRIVWDIGRLPTVEADASLLRQVVANLLSNAIKYTQPCPEARIVIDVAPRAGGAPADEVTLFVRDNGVGFDMQYAHKLFGVFQRLHREEEFEGIGIGLATVRRIVHRHGGQVWAESQPGQGATFYFTLKETPRAPDPQ